jgi:hypothetical protein
MFDFVDDRMLAWFVRDKICSFCSSPLIVRLFNDGVSTVGVKLR